MMKLLACLGQFARRGGSTGSLMMFSGSFARLAPRPHIARKFVETGLGFRSGGIVLVLAGAWLFLAQSLVAGRVVGFKQAANNDPGFGFGNIHWVTSIIQANNSIYFEGMSVRQRVLFAGLPSTAGNHHSLLFRHQFTKGGLHAYDFLTSYAQAQAEDLADLGVMVVLNPCGFDIGPPSNLGSTCAALHDSTNFADVSVPSDTFVSKDG